MVLDTHRRWPDGVQLTVKRLRRAGYNIGYTRVYRILKSNGLVTASPAESRQRKWVRYGRLCSNAMWHTDWHAMKDPRMNGLNLMMYAGLPEWRDYWYTDIGEAADGRKALARWAGA